MGDGAHLELRAPAMTVPVSARSRVVPVLEPRRDAGAVRQSGSFLLAVAFGCLVADVTADGPVSSWEARVCQSFGPAPRWARLASLLPERTVVVPVVGAVLARRRSRGRPVLGVVVRVGGGMLARAAVAAAVQRPRPPRAWWRAEPHGWSFPSRHTTHALLVAATVADELGAPGSPAGRIVVAACTGAVGASRVRLGVHRPTDVLGAVLASAVWLRATRSFTRSRGDEG